MLIFSIDPGIVNIGVCLYNSSTGTVMWADKVQLAPTLKKFKGAGGEDILIDAIHRQFIGSGDTKCQKCFSVADIVLVERQMKRVMIVIQHLIASMCRYTGRKCVMVAPQSIKTVFNTGKTGRVKKRCSVKGQKNNYKANKAMAISKAMELFPQYMTKVGAKKRDDVADAILQAVGWSRKNAS